MPELDLEKVLEETQEEQKQETTQETTETKTEETTQETKEETTQTETKTEETTEKDPFADLTEVTDLNKQFVTTADGKRVKVQDLIDGNMRQDDYTQKTMELSEARHQLELAKASAAAPKAEPKKTGIDLTEQNKAIEAALADMDETDPLAITLKGIYAQNNTVIDFINNQTKASAEASASSTAEENAQNAQKLIGEAIEKEAKNYNLPNLKVGEEETKTKDLWNQLVLTELQATNENLTLSQFNHRVNQIGKKAYKQLRGLISAASANKSKEETAAGEGSTQKETKETKTTEETTQTEVGIKKGLNLGQLLTNALDRRP